MLEKNCPNKNDLNLFRIGETSATQKDKIELHLASCAKCRQILSNIFLQNSSESESYKAPNSLIEKVKGLPPTPSQTETNNNQNVQEISISWYRKNFFQIAFATSILICVGFFGFYILQLQENPTSDDVFRNGSGNKSSIQLISPENNVTFSLEKITFSWSKIDDAKSYTLILSDEKGDIFKKIETEKLNLSRTISELDLVKGKTYFWQIKVKLKDGLSIESENQKFSIAK